MVGASVASFLRASSPEHSSLANLACGSQNLEDDDVCTSASTGSTCSELPHVNGFEEKLFSELVSHALMPEMLSLDFTPPPTPQTISCSGLTSPPLAPRVQVMPPLMKALKLNSAELVEEVLIQEPGIAFFPFWDHHVEPPLCFAVRHRCSAAVVRLLLQHGADPQSEDIHGKCPADIVISMRASMFDSACYKDLRTVEQILGVKSDVAVASPALPPHRRPSGVAELQPSWEGGSLPSWNDMDDMDTSNPPWGNFLPWFSKLEFNASSFHRQQF